MSKTILLKDLFDEAIKGQWFSKKNRNIPKRHKMSDEKDIIGFINVNKVHCDSCRQGFMYQYDYYVKEIGGKRYISSIDFIKLRDKVKSRGFEWGVEDYYYARKFAKKLGLPLKDLM